MPTMAPPMIRLFDTRLGGFTARAASVRPTLMADVSDMVA
jgi:hypothetical protein